MSTSPGGPDCGAQQDFDAEEESELGTVIPFGIFDALGYDVELTQAA